MIKKHETVTDDPPIRIYGNITESRITFKIEAMKLLGSTKSKK